MRREAMEIKTEMKWNGGENQIEGGEEEIRCQVTVLEEIRGINK